MVPTHARAMAATESRRSLLTDGGEAWRIHFCLSGLGAFRQK